MTKAWWLVLIVCLMTAGPVVGASLGITGDLVAEVNSLRSAKRVANLTWNKQLALSAQAKANDMAKNGYFSHVNLQGVGLTNLLARYGYSYSQAGENLAYGYGNADEIVAEWSKNPEHRSNMLNFSYVDTGVGLARGQYEGREVVFVVQHFGKPAQVNISNNTEEDKVQSRSDGSSKIQEQSVSVANDVAVTPPEEMTTDNKPVELSLGGESIDNDAKGTGDGKFNWWGGVLLLSSILGAIFMAMAMKNIRRV